MRVKTAADAGPAAATVDRLVLQDGDVYVVRVWRAGAGIRAPADARQPDLPEPDHVHDAERARVPDRPGRKRIAVRPVGPGRDAAVGDHHEVAGSPERMFAPALPSVAADGLTPEAGEPDLVDDVNHARRDALAAGRVGQRAGLPGECAVGVALGRLSRGLFWPVIAGRDDPTEIGRAHV